MASRPAAEGSEGDAHGGVAARACRCSRVCPAPELRQDRAGRGAAALRGRQHRAARGRPRRHVLRAPARPCARHAPARGRPHDHAYEPRARARSSASLRCSAARCAPRRSRRSTTCRRSAILAADLKRLLNEHPEIAVKLLGALGEKLREANARIARQSFQKVSSRVAGVLAELAETGSRSPARDGRLDGAPREVVVHPPRPTWPSSPAPRGRPPAASWPRCSGPGS